LITSLKTGADFEKSQQQGWNLNWNGAIYFAMTFNFETKKPAPTFKLGFNGMNTKTGSFTPDENRKTGA